jgi:ATP-dependent RNA helicase DeaD
METEPNQSSVAEEVIEPDDESTETFKDLGLSDQLIEVIEELGYAEPTPIQRKAIPELLDGYDVIGQAQTGSGKTAAFGLPLVEYIDPDSEETQAIILTPTRELCIQVTQALRSYCEHLPGVEVVAVFGGAPIRDQQSRLRGGAQIVVATVGRMKDLIARRSLVLTSARYVVLDEADEMLDLGFIEDVEQIMRMCPSGRQTALFSATMPGPVARLAEQYMYDPVTIRVTPKKLTVDSVEQAFVKVDQKDKSDRLVEVLKSEKPEQAIVFCRTKIGASKLGKQLSDRGLRVKALHGDLSQGQRDGVMIAFKEQKVPILVATDIAARGLDIDHVTHVINYDLPNSTETYVHRIGRTGRVGRSGKAVTFVTPKQTDELRQIEREAKTPIVEWTRPGNGSGRKPATDDAKPEQKSAAPARESKDPNGAVKLFCSRGSQSGIEEADLRFALEEGAVIPSDQIASVRVLDRFSFIELQPEAAEKAIEFLNGTKLKGAEVRFEHARD